ncbi:MAG: hypothetical protein F4145_08980 [Boseongicola sp. SB0675_bin_26]|nr:hypothetical protein [Boseongicola sp. SB0675_bin_26]
MTAKADRSRRQRCVTCTPSEWRAIKARARAEGVDVSAYILSRVLDGEAPDGPPHPEAGYPMALTGAEQRRQLEHVERLVADRHRLLEERFVWDTETTLRKAVRFLVLASCADRPQETGPGAEVRGEGTPGDRPEPATASSPAPAMDRDHGAAAGADSGFPSVTGTAGMPGASPPPDPPPFQAGLFDDVDAGPPSGDDAPERDLLDDVVEELNRDGDP